MSKPDWALMMRNASDLEQQADAIRREAQGMRCAVEESNGMRCTADASRPHAHRYDREDLP